MLKIVENVFGLGAVMLGIKEEQHTTATEVEGRCRLKTVNECHWNNVSRADG